MNCRAGVFRGAVFIPTLAGLALLAAGCGGGGPSTVASLASSTTASPTTARTGALAFSRCMRSSGVPNFPDPPARQATSNLSLSHLGVGGAQFDAAWHACAHLLPNGGQPSQSELGQVISGLLAFGRCMRRHGIPSFPDARLSWAGSRDRIAVHVADGQTARRAFDCRRRRTALWVGGVGRIGRRGTFPHTGAGQRHGACDDEAMRLWRLTRTGQTALDGAGTLKHGGRYSPPGVPSSTLLRRQGSRCWSRCDTYGLTLLMRLLITCLVGRRSTRFPRGLAMPTATMRSAIG